MSFNILDAINQAQTIAHEESETQSTLDFEMIKSSKSLIQNYHDWLARGATTKHLNIDKALLDFIHSDKGLPHCQYIPAFFWQVRLERMLKSKFSIVKNKAKERQALGKGYAKLFKREIDYWLRLNKKLIDRMDAIDADNTIAFYGVAIKKKELIGLLSGTILNAVNDLLRFKQGLKNTIALPESKINTPAFLLVVEALQKIKQFKKHKKKYTRAINKSKLKEKRKQKKAGIVINIKDGKKFIKLE